MWSAYQQFFHFSDLDTFIQFIFYMMLASRVHTGKHHINWINVSVITRLARNLLHHIATNEYVSQSTLDTIFLYQ